MNPFLEQPGYWLDFHQSFAIHIRGALVQLVGPKYFVRIEQRLYLSEWPEDEQGKFFGEADVSVHHPNRRKTIPYAPTALLDAPVKVFVEMPEAKTGLNVVEILDRHSEAVVTVIEILSPSNKIPGDDRAAYMEKRAEIWRTNVNLVEIDLLRGGPKLPAQGMTKSDYHILVSRPADRPHAGVWPFNLRDPIPPFPVPLRDGDAAVELSLKPVLDRLYDEADYGRYLYRHPPVPPLSPEDAAWANEILKSSRHPA